MAVKKALHEDVLLRVRTEKPKMFAALRMSELCPFRVILIGAKICATFLVYTPYKMLRISG